MDSSQRLFSKTDLEDYFIIQKKKAINKIQSKNLPVNTDAAEYTNYILDITKIIPVQLQLSESQTTYRQLTLDKDKYFVRVRIPYTGDKVLFNLFPIDFRYSDLPHGRAGTELVVLHFVTDITTSKNENEGVIQTAITNLEDLVKIVNKKARAYNKWLDAKVLNLVERRIEKSRRIQEGVGGFKFTNQ